LPVFIDNQLIAQNMKTLFAYLYVVALNFSIKITVYYSYLTSSFSIFRQLASLKEKERFEGYDKPYNKPWKVLQWNRIDR